MATVTIGGKEYSIPPLTFKSLKRVWPFLETAAKSEDPFENVGAALAVISEGLSRSETPMTVEEIEDLLFGSEVPPLEKTMGEIMAEGGLVKAKADGTIITGEAMGEAAPPSTEISTDSSPSLSPPDVLVETGTQ